MNKETLKKIIEENSETSNMLFNMYYVSLISSDTCIDIKSCEESLRYLKELKSNLEDLELNTELKQEYLNRVNLGLEIVERDLKMYKNGGGFGC